MFKHRLPLATYYAGLGYATLQQHFMVKVQTTKEHKLKLELKRKAKIRSQIIQSTYLQ